MATITAVKSLIVQAIGKPIRKRYISAQFNTQLSALTISKMTHETMTLGMMI
jgi:hypothetical protein